MATALHMGVVPSALILAISCIVPAAQAEPEAGCTSFRGYSADGVVVNSASVVAAEEGVPDYCKVQGHVDTGIGFELRLPTTWNGKLLFQGYGALDGAPPSVTQTLTLGSPGGRLPVMRGYAVTTTDTGHTLPPDATIANYGDWAIDNPRAQENWAHRSTLLVAQASKRLVARYYGREPSYSYYHGCSGGGRHALMVAQRHPDVFDGVVAGAPWLSPTTQVAAMHWQVDAARVLATKLPVIAQAVLASCDALDGLEDGLVENPAVCSFDPEKLSCVRDDAVDCLTSEQVRVLRAIYKGPGTSAGERISPGYVRGSEMAWTSVIVPPPGGRSANDLLQSAFLRGFVLGVAYDGRSFDYNANRARLASVAKLVDVKPDLTAFQARGGKVLMWHGWHDARISPWDSVRFYERASAALSGVEGSIDDFFRLFMAPGVQHCSGGPGPNTFDALGVLEDWVESGIAPDRIVAMEQENGTIRRTRPLCPYPQQAVYEGHGSENDAVNFVCNRVSAARPTQ